MSKEHKQKLQLHRHTLVDNMISDDIFNDLIASQVITTADVSRIKVGQRSRPWKVKGQWSFSVDQRLVPDLWSQFSRES